MRPTNSTKAMYLVQPLTAMWLNVIKMEISEHHSTAQDAAERTSRKLSSHFSPSYCKQSFGTLRVFPI
jgi:hypothetical protein